MRKCLVFKRSRQSVTIMIMISLMFISFYLLTVPFCFLWSHRDGVCRGEEVAFISDSDGSVFSPSSVGLCYNITYSDICMHEHI